MTEIKPTKIFIVDESQREAAEATVEKWRKYAGIANALAELEGLELLKRTSSKTPPPVSIVSTRRSKD